MKKILISLIFVIIIITGYSQKANRIVKPDTIVFNIVKAANFYTATDTLETVAALRDSVNMLLDSIAELDTRTHLAQQITEEDTTRWWTAGVSPTDDILDWSTDKYTPYTSKQSGINFYTGTTNPDGTNRLNLNALLYVSQINAYASSSNANLLTSDAGNAVNAVSNTGVVGVFNAGASSTANLLELQKNSTNKAYIKNNGEYLYTAGTSSTFAKAPGVLKDFLIDDTTSGTGETDLYSYTVPANVLASNGDKLTFKVVFDAADAGGAYISFHFAGDSVIWANGTSLDATGIATFEVIRTSSTTAIISVQGTPVTLTWSSIDNHASLTGLDFTIANIIKVTAQCSTNSITAKYGYIEYKPAAVN